MFCGDVKFGLVWCSGVDDGAPGGCGSGSASTPVAYESVCALATALSQARLPRSYLVPGWIVYFCDNATTTQQQFPAAEHNICTFAEAIEPQNRLRVPAAHETQIHHKLQHNQAQPQTQWRQHAQALLASRAILTAKAQWANQSLAKDLLAHRSKR